MIGKRVYDIVALSAVTMVIVLFFFRLFYPTPQIIITPDFGQSDALNAFSMKYFLHSELSLHKIPLWSSLIGGGYPIFAEGAMATFFLPNLVLFSIFPLIWAYNISLVFSLCLMGWGMYAWLRMIGYQRISSTFGAMSTALSGYIIVQLTHITIVQSLCLFPILAALTLRLANKKSVLTVCWIIFVLSQQIFIGFPQCVFITLLFLCVYWIWLIRSTNKQWQKTVLFAIAITGGCVASAAQLLPSIEYLKSLVTATGFTPEQATIFSYPIKHLLTLFNPFALGNPVNGSYPHFLDFDGSIFWENTAYIGIFPLLLITVFLFVKKIRKIGKQSIVFFVILLLASILLMTGKHSPLYFIFSFWPFSLFRVPSRFIWLFEIALIVMSVHALNCILEYFKKTRIVFLVSILCISIHILSLFYIWSPYHALVPSNEWLKNPSLSQFIDRNFYTLSIGSERLYNATYSPHGWADLTAEKDPSYILRNTFTPDKSMLWTVPVIRDYAGRSIKRSQVYIDLLDQTITSDASNATISAMGSKLLTLLSIKNIITTLPLTQKGLLLHVQLADPTHSIDLYENPDALPSVYFAKRAIYEKTLEDTIKTMITDNFIPGESIIVENPKLIYDASSQGTTHINESRQGEIDINVSNAVDNAILIYTQTYYPGWHATIDGKETSVFPVNIKHIGIQIPLGNHLISFYYKPQSFITGVWISGMTLCIIIVLMVFSWFRSFVQNRRKALSHARHHQRNHDT
jgi:hypothetical protein